MDLALEYKPSHRHSLRHSRLAQRMGWIPAGLTLVLFYAYGAKSGPGLWMALGLSLAFQMMLWSARALPDHPAGRTRWGNRLAASADAWYPYFLIWIQGAFMALTGVIFWSTLGELGYRGGTAQTALLVGWLLLQPIRRSARLAAAESKTARAEVVYYMAHYLGWSLLTVFIALVVGDVASSGSASPLAGLFLWIPVVLIVLTQAILFVDHVVRKLPDAPAARTRRDSLE